MGDNLAYLTDIPPKKPKRTRRDSLYNYQAFCPKALQLYDAQRRLVYDEMLPRGNRLVAFEDGVLWVQGRYDAATQRYWLYKYTFDLEALSPLPED